MKNSYLVENEEIEFRRAIVDDDLETIAELIYKTDPFIYPFWFNKNIKKAKKHLPTLLKRENNLFNIDNFYIAYDKTAGQIVGILCAIDKSVKFSHSYDKDKQINGNYDFTIRNYVEVLENEIEESEFEDLLYISNICIVENLRGKKIGSKLIGYFIS